MNIRCPHCQTVFRVNPARIPPRGVRARCARCGETFTITPPNAGGASGAGPSAGTSAPSPAAPTSPGQARPPADRPRPTAATQRPRPQTPAATQRPGPQTSAATQRPRPQTPAATQRPGPQTPAATQRPGPQATAAPQRPGPQTTAEQRSAAGTDAPTKPSPGARRDEPTASTDAAAGSAPAPTPATAGAGSEPRVFGSSDPHKKAERLARALVSDIVAYHPDRRDKSLEDGSIRSEFRNEILKSWDEYVAQVGMETAKGTPYFRDALNKILAKGQKVF